MTAEPVFVLCMGRSGSTLLRFLLDAHPSLACPPETKGAIAGIRDTMDRMTGAYLARRDRRRFADKSLGSARFADLLVQVYPEARFLCLYRYPMDVIASGLDASPWG